MKTTLIPIQLCRVLTEEASNDCTSQLPYHSYTKTYTVLETNFVKKSTNPVTTFLSIKRPVPLEVADIHTSFTCMINFKCLKIKD
jgi:hypothetical protein